MNFMKTVKTVKEVMNEEIISGNDIIILFWKGTISIKIIIDNIP